ICDVGGGVGMFSVALRALGYQSILVDDFDDPINHAMGSDVLQVHRSYGVDVRSRDVLADSLDLAPGSLDTVTSFDCIEHLHHSPKQLFRTLARSLRPGGTFILCGPNAFNLRKRITTPLGIGSWSSMEDWYEPEKFRGHVREPSLADLCYIAEDI